MCKVMFIAGIKKKHHAKVKQITQEMAKIIGRTDDDGFGYAAITSKGKVFGEKWLTASEVMQPKAKPDIGYGILEAILGAYAKFKTPSTSGAYGRFGTVTKDTIDDTVALMFHGRKKTYGDKSIANTHPFYEVNVKDQPDTAIVHNGSIFNHYQLTKKYSTCDSEVILHEYIKQYMWYNSNGIEAIAEALRGEYTVGALSSILYNDDSVVPYLDIFKSNKDLFAAYAKEIEAVIYTTSEFGLGELGRTCGLTLSALTEVPDGVLIRLNAITGELLEDHVKFKLSDKSYTYETQTHHRNVTPITPPVAKKVTAASDIFSQRYHEISKGLTDIEKKYLIELEEDSKTNLIALELVKRVINL